MSQIKEEAVDTIEISEEEALLENADEAQQSATSSDEALEEALSSSSSRS